MQKSQWLISNCKTALHVKKKENTTHNQEANQSVEIDGEVTERMVNATNNSLEPPLVFASCIWEDRMMNHREKREPPRNCFSLFAIWRWCSDIALGPLSHSGLSWVTHIERLSNITMILLGIQNQLLITKVSSLNSSSSSNKSRK